MVYQNQVYPLVPRTQVILDKTKCTNKPHPSPSSTQTPPTNTSAPGSLATCNAIKRLVINTPINQCHTNPVCDTLDCTTMGYRSLYQILPCSNPPAVHVTLYNANNAVIFNRTITNSTSVPLPLNSKLVITVHHDKPDAIGLEVNRYSVMRHCSNILTWNYSTIIMANKSIHNIVHYLKQFYSFSKGL